MSDVVIKIENLSKLYRLGLVSTGTISHDLNRMWAKIRGKEDPYQKIGESNDRSKKGSSEYVWALKDINLEIKRGERVGIIGKNGAGKSTLLKILSEVTGPTTGSIKMKGRTGSLLEVGTGFHPELTGRENIYMNGTILGMSRAEVTKKLDEIIDFAGVERYIDTPVKRYSSGMMVRLGFAVAAHLEPDILIVDEVLAVGDAEFQKKAIGKMREVSEGHGRTILFVSHNMSSLKKLCNIGIILNNGLTTYIGGIDAAISNYCYVKNIDSTHTKIIDFYMEHSKEVIIYSVMANNNYQRNLTLSFPDRTIEIEVNGNLLNDLRIELELLLFDKNENLLCKFAPHLKDGNINKLKAGDFKIKGIFNLPTNISNGEYILQLDLSNPSIEYLARFPQGIVIRLENYVGKTGISFDYESNGLLLF